MYIPKRYGQSKTNTCPFCGKRSLTENKQGVPVCITHKDQYLDLKCICGEFLDVRKGKWGPYCSCLRCGNISWSKAMEANPSITPRETKPDLKPKPTVKRQTQVKRAYRPIKQTKKETVITSDELDFYC